MRIVDKDESGAVDYSEFASKISEMLGDEEAGEQGDAGASSRRSSSSRPATASADHASQRSMDYLELCVLCGP
jgi:hypothetical protein